jgi:CheY-like chemotaxis protein
LILTDMVMPRMNGRVLVDHLRKSRPDLKALYMSGYTEDSIFHRHAMEEGIDFLEKPLTPESLCRKVREVLDANPSTPLPDSSSVLEENRG